MEQSAASIINPEGSSERSVNFYQITQRLIPEDIIVI
jgi:hypothetical protein